MKLRLPENNLLAWKGDAALMLATRIVLMERYPKMPIRYLQSRQDRIVANFALNRYCQRKGLKYGCNVMEIKIGEQIFSNLDSIKDVIQDIIENDEIIKKMDSIQLAGGDINPHFIAREEKRIAAREKKARIFNAVRKFTGANNKRRSKLIQCCDYIYHLFITRHPVDDYMAQRPPVK